MFIQEFVENWLRRSRRKKTTAGTETESMRRKTFKTNDEIIRACFGNDSKTMSGIKTIINESIAFPNALGQGPEQVGFVLRQCNFNAAKNRESVE